MTDDFWTEQRIERAKELFAQNWSCQLIADDLGTSRSAVGAKLNRLGIKRGPDHLKTGPIPQHVRLSRVNSNSNAMRVTVVQLPARQKVRMADTESRNISLLDLQPDDCRYPIGDPPLFCGHPKVEGSSYCGPHARICGHAVPPRTDSYFPSFRKR